MVDPGDDVEGVVSIFKEDRSMIWLKQEINDGDLNLRQIQLKALVLYASRL